MTVSYLARSPRTTAQNQGSQGPIMAAYGVHTNRSAMHANTLGHSCCRLYSLTAPSCPTLKRRPSHHASASTESPSLLGSTLLASHQSIPDSTTDRVALDFCKWELCWTMPLVDGFPRGSPISPLLHSSAAPYSPIRALKTSMSWVNGPRLEIYRVCSTRNHGITRTLHDNAWRLPGQPHHLSNVLSPLIDITWPEMELRLGNRISLHKMPQWINSKQLTVICAREISVQHPKNTNSPQAPHHHHH
ncbi:hypothetical protein PR048_029784 [Dryococelus australis]|uniref:Uncharacterized protein n=1 Tax=Dryococelus australis TaxID=614101 RepID=A0ABQ9G741_9NEOP|nr:hypothetical protein PR048_029784 [Dryococelus australis]